MIFENDIIISYDIEFINIDENKFNILIIIVTYYNIMMIIFIFENDDWEFLNKKCDINVISFY